VSKNSFNAKKNLEVAGKSFEIFDISAIEGAANLPFSLKVLLENLLRTEDGANITQEHIKALANWDPSVEPDTEIQFTPARVVMQDFTGVPCVVDLATMREAIVELGGDPAKVNPLAPAELVIDHSVIADKFGTKDSFEQNTDIEYERNQERYRFLRWGQSAFDEFKVVPPGTGIVHQVNIEYLARVVMIRTVDGVVGAYPDTVVGTDSHTTMVNGLGVLGWGVGGIEAEAALLGQPVSMLIPSVVGFKLTGQLPLGTTATDMALTITEILRKVGVVGKFVEFFGSGVASVPMANRTTIGNMSPEYGSTCAIFPIDEETLRYLRLTGRSDEQIALVQAYAKKQGMWHDPYVEPRFSQVVELDLSTVVPSISGPKRPQDRIALSDSKMAFEKVLPTYLSEKTNKGEVKAGATRVKNGDVVIASITSCTNTSNPSVMIGAALLAKKAVEKGLKSKPWVKTTLAPGSKVVTDYYDRADLTKYMQALGFHLVGYGCVTCIGNSGPLPIEVGKAIHEGDLAVTAVLSGNRNFEGRISPEVKMNYLASPPLVVAYAIAGTMDHDFENDSLGKDTDGKDVYLKDIWPSPQEIQSVIDSSISSEMFKKDYATVFEGDHRWKSLATPTGKIFEWDAKSTYVRRPPYFDGMPKQPTPVTDISGARVLAILGDSVTTDHISPAGNIKADSPAGIYLAEHGIDYDPWNVRKHSFKESLARWRRRWIYSQLPQRWRTNNDF
jgi:aconitate hydratase